MVEQDDSLSTNVEYLEVLNIEKLLLKEKRRESAIASSRYLWKVCFELRLHHVHHKPLSLQKLWASVYQNKI